MRFHVPHAVPSRHGVIEILVAANSAWRMSPLRYWVTVLIAEIAKPIDAGDGAVRYVHPKARLYIKSAVAELPAQLHRRDESVDHARRLDIHRIAGGEHAHRYRPGRIVGCTEKIPAGYPDEGGGSDGGRHAGCGAMRVEGVVAGPG